MLYYICTGLLAHSHSYIISEYITYNLRRNNKLCEKAMTKTVGVRHLKVDRFWNGSQKERYQEGDQRNHG